MHTEPGLDRTNDHVYLATTSVVRAVMEMTRGVQTCTAELYTELVRVSLTPPDYHFRADLYSRTLHRASMGLASPHHQGTL